MGITINGCHFNGNNVTIIGGLIIGVLNNGLNLLNVNSFWQYVVKGVVILLAVFLDYFRNKGKK